MISVRVPRRRRCPMVAATARLIPPSLRVAALLVADDGITIRVITEAAAARCPLCGEPADRVHSRATRTLADLPWAGKPPHDIRRLPTGIRQAIVGLKAEYPPLGPFELARICRHRFGRPVSSIRLAT